MKYLTKKNKVVSINHALTLASKALSQKLFDIGKEFIVEALNLMHTGDSDKLKAEWNRLQWVKDKRIEKEYHDSLIYFVGTILDKWIEYYQDPEECDIKTPDEFDKDEWPYLLIARCKNEHSVLDAKEAINNIINKTSYKVKMTKYVYNGVDDYEFKIYTDFGSLDYMLNSKENKNYKIVQSYRRKAVEEAYNDIEDII